MYHTVLVFCTHKQLRICGKLCGKTYFFCLCIEFLFFRSDKQFVQKLNDHTIREEFPIGKTKSKEWGKLFYIFCLGGFS